VWTPAAPGSVREDALPCRRSPSLRPQHRMEATMVPRLVALVRRGGVDDVSALLDRGAPGSGKMSQHVLVNAACEGVTPMVGRIHSPCSEQSLFLSFCVQRN